MEMTIDKAKTQLIMQKSYALGKDYEAIEVALDTMRKYQKIVQILHNGFGKGVYAVFDEIVKVIEDGNVD